jgi:ketosteroid isomerase-like protein
MSEHDQVAHNLAVVNAHFQSESIRRIEPALDFYTDDIVWEAPSRQLSLRGKDAVAENYRAMFSFKG